MTLPTPITLQYFDDCPNGQTTRAHLETPTSEGHPLTLVLQRIGSPEEAESAGSRGSPTVLVDGIDPFADFLRTRRTRLPDRVDGRLTGTVR